MRIGIDARYGLRNDRRGIGRYIYNLLDALERDVQDEQFILYADILASPELVQRFSNAHFEVRVLNPANLFLWEQILLPLAAARDKIDLLHCPANTAPVVKICPTVLTILDVIEFRRASFGNVELSFRHRLSRFYRMRLLPRIARIATNVITVSEFSREDIMRALSVPREKIKVTYLGLPREISSNGESAEQPGECYIFALGATDRRKNIDVLFEAFSILRAGGHEGVKLIIAGVEDLELFYQKTGLHKHPFRQDIDCFGFVAEPHLESLYRHSACFVYPSLYEGFGLPPLEAMASGAPVVASKSTSVGEIVGDAGLLFDPRNPSELAAKIESILDDPGLGERLRKQGQERVSHFSWQKCARETLEIYRDVYHGKLGE